MLENISMGLVVPIAAFAVVITAFALIVTIAKNYHKVPPNRVAVVYGRAHKGAGGIKKGYKIVAGGGFLRIPILESVSYLDLNVMTFPVSVQNVPDKNGALVSVSGTANVKILSDEASLALAVERFLGQSMEQVKTTGKENLEGNLRAIVGKMTIEELINNRGAFQSNVLTEAGQDLAKLGLGCDLLTIQDMKDERGYITSLGKKRTAEVVRDATIGEAEAHRDADTKSAMARQQGEIAKAAAEQAVSDANRERDMVVAQNAAKVAAEQAKIDVAAQVASAEMLQKLNAAEVEAKRVKTEAEIALQEVERKRKDAELNATVIVKAEREREAKVIAAEADRSARLIAAEAAEQASTKEGEALRVKAEKEGQGKQAQLTAEAQGRMRVAEAVKAEMTAHAEGERAKLLAQAEGEKARLLAEAEGRKALLLAEGEGLRAKALAEAEGILKKAEALKQLDESGRILLIMEHLPEVIKAAGGALRDMTEPAAKAIGEGLSNVDEIRIIDMGGSANGEGSALQKFSNTPVEALFQIVEKAKATGMGPAFIEIGKRVGVDLTALFAGAPSQADPSGTISKS